MFYVYIIRSETTGKHYIGYTKDIEQRLKQHNANLTKSIRNKGPFRLVHKEQYQTYQEAFRRERQIKRYKDGEAFKKIIAGM